VQRIFLIIKNKLGPRRAPSLLIASAMQISEVTETLPFANKEGGVWRQGWDIKYGATKWTEAAPLEVVVVRI